jgi:hypothetical protein
MSSGLGRIGGDFRLPTWRSPTLPCLRSIISSKRRKLVKVHRSPSFPSHPFSLLDSSSGHVELTLWFL